MDDTPHRTAQDTTAAVDAFMGRLVHPLKDAIQRLRTFILQTDPSIAEGVKWNAPSFRTRDYFATMHLRARGGFGLVLHRGATSKATAERLPVDDSTGLLEWLATDRAMVRFTDCADVEGKREPLQTLLKSWIVHA